MKNYKYPFLFKDNNNLILAPNSLLNKYIANYTLTVPTNMDIEQKVVPSASSTLVYSFDSKKVIGGLRGVNTEIITIGKFASSFDFLVLIELHAGGAYAFTGIPQSELLNQSFMFDLISKSIDKKIHYALQTSYDIISLKQNLDNIFLESLRYDLNEHLFYMSNKIILTKGTKPIRELVEEIGYSERHVGRLFQQYIGTSPKKFAQIVRMKNVVNLLEKYQTLEQLSLTTGYYDISHLLKEFKYFLGVFPTEYKDNMSIFYSDSYKLR